jgi:AcrR family transcriptional regulator
MTGLRESKKRATRSRLEEVAFALFLRQGYDETSVTDVAAGAEVSERTFFRYFSAKQDVVFADLVDALEGFADDLHHALVAPEPSWSDVIGALRGYAEVLEPNRERNRQRAQLVRATPCLLAPANQQLAGWRYRACTTMADRYGRPLQDEDIQLLAGMTSAVLTSAMTAWVDEHTTLAAAVERAADRARVLLGRDGAAAR